MTHLRKVMLEELERRNYTESTTHAYLRIVEEFARFFNRPPDQLGTGHIREYIAHLFRVRKLADNTGPALGKAGRPVRCDRRGCSAAASAKEENQPRQRPE